MQIMSEHAWEGAMEVLLDLLRKVEHGHSEGVLTLRHWCLHSHACEPVSELPVRLAKWGSELRQPSSCRPGMHGCQT